MQGFAALCCTYDDHIWLPFAIGSVYSEVEVVIFLVSSRPWRGPQTSNRETLEAIRSLPDPERKFVVIEGDWPNETVQRNHGLSIMMERGIPYCFVLDADEVYDPVVLRAMQEAAHSRPDIGCWYMSWYTYWKSYCYRIDPPEHYTPAVFLKVGQAHFADNRNTFSNGHANIPPVIGMCHHLSYAHTNEQLLRKITTFSHSHEIRAGWYEDVWLKWDSDPTLENLHPIYPEAYKRAIPVSSEQLPPILRRLDE